MLTIVLDSKGVLVCGVLHIFLRTGLCLLLSFGSASCVRRSSALLPAVRVFLWFTGVSGWSQNILLFLFMAVPPLLQYTFFAVQSIAGSWNMN